MLKYLTLWTPTHPPIKHIQSVTLSLYIYFGWFMGWVVGWLQGSWGGWLEGSWGEWVCECVGGGGMGGWRVHGVDWCVVGYVVGWVVGELMGWVYILTHP